MSTIRAVVPMRKHDRLFRRSERLPRGLAVAPPFIPQCLYKLTFPADRIHLEDPHCLAKAHLPAVRRQQQLCGIREKTFAGTHGNGRDAPISGRSRGADQSAPLGRDAAASAKPGMPLSRDSETVAVGCHEENSSQ